MADVPQPISIPSDLESLFDRKPPQEPGERFLRFHLSPEDTALLPVRDIAGVTAVSASEILPVPELPACVLGIYSWRGETLWLVDLPAQLNLDSPYEASAAWEEAIAIVVEDEGKLLGLVVSAISEIEQHDPRLVRSPPPGVFPTPLMPYVAGYLVASTSIVLSARALVGDVRWQQHAGAS